MIRERFFSFVMVLGIAFLLLVSLVLSAVLASLGKYFSYLPESVSWLSQLLNFLVSFVVITLLFAMIFKTLPDAKVGWRDVWLGALLTSALFTVGKFAIGLQFLGALGEFSAVVPEHFDGRTILVGWELIADDRPIRRAAHRALEMNH